MKSILEKWGKNETSSVELQSPEPEIGNVRIHIPENAESVIISKEIDGKTVNREILLSECYPDFQLKSVDERKSFLKKLIVKVGIDSNCGIFTF